MTVSLFGMEVIKMAHLDLVILAQSSFQRHFENCQTVRATIVHSPVSIAPVCYFLSKNVNTCFNIQYVQYTARKVFTCQ